MNRDQHVISLTTDGKLAQEGETVSTRAQLAGILEAFAASGKPSLTLVFHGGLVNEANGLAIAEAFYRQLPSSAETYPVFVIWRSGHWEILRDGLLAILSDSSIFGPVLQKVLKHLRQKYPALEAILPDGLGEREMAPALAEITDADMAALQADLAADPAAAAALQAILVNAERLAPALDANAEMMPASAPEPAPETDYLSASLLRELQAQQPPAGSEAELGLGIAAWAFAGRILKAVGMRFLVGTDHGIYATVLEEMYRAMYGDKVGRFFWDAMKGNAAGAYADNPAAAAPEEQLHGMTLFLELLQAHMQTHGKFPVHLIGHSAGAIHICHLLARAARVWDGDFEVSTVLLAAPACSVKLFREQLVPSLGQIGTVRVFAMQDELEREDVLVPVAYPHSLLYFVSGLLEEKADTGLLGLARHMRGRATTDKDLLAVRSLIAEGKISLVLSKTASDAPAGEQAGFVSHYGEKGPFRDPALLASLAAQTAPPLEDNLQPVEVVITREMDSWLQPSAGVILGNDDAGTHSTDDLLAWQLGGGPSASPAEGEGREVAPLESGLELDAQLEAIIGENELVDHRLVQGLLQVGRAVARIVVSAVTDFTAVPPDARPAAWQAAADAKTLIRAYGTGWVFGGPKRLLMTNNHVIPLVEAARTAAAQFGYENGLRGAARPQRVLALDPDAFFLTSPNLAFGGLDYTLVALNAEQQALFADDLVALDAVQGVTAATARSIYLVQHPKGDPKAYVLNHNRKVNLSEKYVTYISDTLPGSSGSPLFNDDLRLVGIHHLGNYPVTIGTRSEQTNLGSRIEVILADIVAQLRARAFTDEQVEHWFGRGVLFQMWRR